METQQLDRAAPPGRPPQRRPGALPRASAADSAAFAADVLMPLAARGVIVRRPRVVGLLDRVDADRRAVRRMQRLRAGRWTLTRSPGPGGGSCAASSSATARVTTMR